MAAVAPVIALTALFSPSARALEPEQAEAVAEGVNPEWLATSAAPSPPVPPQALNDVENPGTPLEEAPQQTAQASVVQITDVQLNSANGEVELVLQTTGELAAPETSVTGNAAIADIPNATLNLPEGEEFFASNPVEGIALINITTLPDNQVRVAITGTDAPPVVSITAEASSLRLSATPGDPSAQAPDEEAIQVVVTGEQDEDYFVPNASTATRTNTPILETPRSIQVIPRQVLEDQQVTNLDQALRNVSGVIDNGTDTATNVRFSIRGFDFGFNDAPVLQDGFRQFGANAVAPDVAIIERIEVLRGPASILYGQIQPGGVINVVTKQPLREPFYEAQLQVGSFGLIRPQIDLSGPLTEDGRLLYRLNALYENKDGFRDFDQDLVNRFLIAPIVSWDISDRTRLTLELQVSEQEEQSDQGTLAFGDGVIDTPRDRIFGEPDDFIQRNLLNVGYTLEHQFSDNWTLRNAFRFTDVSVSSDKLTIPLFFNENTGILGRAFSSIDVDTQNYSLQTNIIGEFSTGSIGHTLLFGVDLNRSENSNLTLANFAPSFLNVFNPTYGVTRPNLNLVFVDGETQNDRLGVYLQDQIQFSDNLNLLLGLRYDTISQEFISGPSFFNPAGAQNTRNDDALTSQIGILYQPIENLSLYASYSQSFVPNGDTTVSGDILEPERGEGFEVGVKAELLDGDLLATLTYFDITKQNVATADPNNPFFSVSTGEQQSRGVEFDVIGEILPGWNILASYAYTDATVSRDNTIPVGNRLAGIPFHSASLWTTYQIQTGDLQGLRLGVGINYLSDRQGDLDNSFELDSYFLTNAAVFYRRDNWRFALNFNNIFDVNYINGTPFSRVRGGAIPGEPFNVVGSISVQF
ncbi:MAG: TonB-dependent siderophore receptor [Leptolyngbya sp. SIO4C5]|nr:TonB-dependent siderophore receptor [Leptolyngbya sp. SIO4C5]